MSKYIKLDTAIEHTNELYHGDEVEEWLESLPTIDIVKWNHETDFDGFCSAGERIDK